MLGELVLDLFFNGSQDARIAALLFRSSTFTVLGAPFLQFLLLIRSEFVVLAQFMIAKMDTGGFRTPLFSEGVLFDCVSFSAVAVLI